MPTTRLPGPTILEAQHLRQLSQRSLRAYAYDLLHFERWVPGRPQTVSEITESTLLDYVRHQLSQRPILHRKP
jgi:hypothetical protein